jgi:GH15 family glucan-1,4-alpha-glucosidase
MQTAALVGRDGSIDWLCLPRFDSGACFAALLGRPEHGRWQIAPAGEIVNIRRKYRGDSLVLETEFTTREGVVRVVDCMPPREETPDLVRVVEGVSGRVPMRMELVVRFDYGSIVPWVRKVGGAWRAIAGPDALSLWCPIETRGEGLTTQAAFEVGEGDAVPFVLAWHQSALEIEQPVDGIEAVRNAESWWAGWAARCTYQGPFRSHVVRSAVTLKALTFAPTGGIVAAATTSLPERLGGVRNWDYRYCWLRDATFTLYALVTCGYVDEAIAWRNWLVRAVAGDTSQLQIMYGPAGERRLPELELPWLPGFAGSAPVRIGNAAHEQRQLDVYGEVMAALYLMHRSGVESSSEAWRVQSAMLDFLEKGWTEPDEGIWEVRGPKRPFTHSKVMAWLAFDRGVQMIERFGFEGPRDRWAATRDRIHAEVCDRGFDKMRSTFTQYYGSRELDASLLMLPLVGFLPPEDERVRGTIAAIERHLVEQGFVRRYQEASEHVDGLPPGEGVFLPCTLWLADNYVQQGRLDDAERLFRQVLGVANDVGLLSEEYDPAARRQLGNFPQAFSHVSLINTAENLMRARQSGERVQRI